MHVALGGSARTVERHRVADYMAYYRTVKAAFEARVDSRRGIGGAVYPPAATYPEPVEHCEVCRWSLVVPGAAPGGRRPLARRRRTFPAAPALKGRGVATRRGLAALELPLPAPLDGVGAAALATARDQAAIQVRGQDEGRMLYELLPPSRLSRRRAANPIAACSSLPEPRPGDLFFDIEGDPVRPRRWRRLPVRDPGAGAGGP